MREGLKNSEDIHILRPLHLERHDIEFIIWYIWIFFLTNGHNIGTSPLTGNLTVRPCSDLCLKYFAVNLFYLTKQNRYAFLKEIIIINLLNHEVFVYD